MEENHGTPAMKGGQRGKLERPRKKRQKEGIYVREDRYNDMKNKLVFNINNRFRSRRNLKFIQKFYPLMIVSSIRFEKSFIIFSMSFLLG